MTYSESAKGIRIDAKRAATEIARHGLDPVEDFAEFARDCPAGRDGMWDASAVLEWLGY